MSAVLRVAVLVALLAVSMGARSGTAIFYQPLSSDRKVADTEWPALFERVHAQGFDTLVVQWVEYGDAFADPDGRAWLSKRLREAHAAGFKLVLGLGGDPAFFERQKVADPELAAYLEQLTQRDSQLARRWSDVLGGDLIAGWYLPLEIDDVRWRDADARKLLVRHLGNEVRALQKVLPRPVYVTSFFAGNMAPGPYAQLLDDLGASGVRLWVQDGAGTGRLDAAERRLYLAPAHACGKSVVRGVVHEIFRQVAHDRVFAAVPLSSDQLSRVLAQRAPCGGETAFFSMRYLPGMGALLHAR